MRTIPELKWDMKDFGLEHNAYVNDLIRDLRTFSAKLAERQQLPPKCRKVAWDTVLFLLMECLVEVRASLPVSLTRPATCRLIRG